MKDLTGMRFGKWTVIERAYDTSMSKGQKWLCQCDCGTKKIVWGKYLRNGKSQSCGCSHERKWVGERFGRLVITSVEKDGPKNIYHCRCDCGNTIDVVGTSIYQTKSCGCSRRSSHVGERYGMLVVDEMLYNMNGDGVTYVSCTCDCGRNGYITKLNSLSTGNTKSCGCIHNPDLTGVKFGRLTVLRQIKSDTPQRRWLCKCDCGSEVEALSYWLTSGHVKSCGCLRSEKNSSSEIFLRHILDDMGVKYIPEHTFQDCIGVKGWRLRFDFYLPEHRMAIEYDGEQHFHPVEFWGGDKKYELQKENDKIKNLYCAENDILLLRLPYTESEEDIIKLLSEYINIQESRNDHSLKGND